MEQDSESPGFVPRTFDDILATDDDAMRREPAGRPEPIAEAPAPVETGEAAAPADAKPKAEQPRDDAGRFAQKAAEAPQQATGSPPAENATPQSVPASALVEERRKWQAKVKELEARLAQPAPQPQPMPQQPPEPPLEELVFQDPQRFVQALAQRQEEALLQTRIATSEAVARQQPDYADAEAALTAYAQSSQAAAQEVARMLRSHPAPAIWAYQAGKHLMAQRPEAIEQRIEAEVQRRLSERAPPPPAPSSAPPPPPASLASARSAVPRAQWNGPAPTRAIFGAKSR